MAFRFVHTADLHLDSPLKSVSLRDAGLADQIGIATRTAFSRIVDLCIGEAVDLLLIAGDVWDGQHSSTKTPRFLKHELLRLNAAGVRCCMIRGNHDALARQTGELDLPDNTVLFGARAGTHMIETRGHRVAIHGISFRDPHAADSLLPHYPPAIGDAFNIGLMHTSLNGSPGHDSYAPCSLRDLDEHGYQYWALGHIHRRAQHDGRATVVMPGIPQGRDIGEAGPASVTLGTVDDDGVLGVQERCVASLRFERVSIDCTGIDDWRQITALLDRELRRMADLPRPEDHLVLRPVLQGATSLSWRMARDHDRLTEEARAAADQHANLWIDKVELRVTAPVDAARRAGSHLPHDLTRLVLDDLSDDPALIAAMSEVAQDLIRQLPAELRDLLGHDDAQLQAECRRMLDSGAPAILSRLSIAEDI